MFDAALCYEKKKAYLQRRSAVEVVVLVRAQFVVTYVGLQSLEVCLELVVAD